MSQTAGLLFRKIRNAVPAEGMPGSGRRALVRPRRFSLRTGPRDRAARAGRGTFEDTLPPFARSAALEGGGGWRAEDRARSAALEGGGGWRAEDRARSAALEGGGGWRAEDRARSAALEGGGGWRAEKGARAEGDT